MEGGLAHDAAVAPGVIEELEALISARLRLGGRIVIVATLRMDQIIDELLRLSRLGSQRLKREAVNLSGSGATFRFTLLDSP